MCVDEREVHKDKPLCVGAGFQESGTGSRKCRGARGRRCLKWPHTTSPPPMSRREGQGISGSFASVGKPWGSGVCSHLGGRGCHPRRGRRSWGFGALTRRPATGGVWRIGARHCLPPQAQDPQHARSRRPPAAAPPPPPKPRDAFSKAPRAIRPTLDTQGTVCCPCSTVHLYLRTSIHRAKQPPPPLDCR